MTEEHAIRIVPISEMEKAADLEPLWGNWIFRNCVVLQAGEPGIKKTTYNYSFAKAIVDNEPFLEVKPTESGMTILMLDWESSDSLIKSRMRSMGYPKHCDHFLLYNDPRFTLQDIEGYVEKLGIRPDIIFVDPIRYAFAMRDENDNAEASRQAKFLRGIATKYHCAVIIVHHSSKAEMSGWKKASGASARTSLSDISMNFDGLGEGYDSSIFRLSIPKNRLIDDHFIAFIEGKSYEGYKGFKIVEPPLGYTISGDYEPSLRQYNSQQWVELMLNPYAPKSAQQIHQELGEHMTIQAVYNHLSHLLTLGKAERTSYGKYIKNSHGLVK